MFSFFSASYYPLSNTALIMETGVLRKSLVRSEFPCHIYIFYYTKLFCFQLQAISHNFPLDLSHTIQSPKFVFCFPIMFNVYLVILTTMYEKRMVDRVELWFYLRLYLHYCILQIKTWLKYQQNRKKAGKSSSELMLHNKQVKFYPTKNLFKIYFFYFSVTFRGSKNSFFANKRIRLKIWRQRSNQSLKTFSSKNFTLEKFRPT